MNFTEHPVNLHPSQAHRIWRLMNALILAHPEWADPDTFEAARVKMIRLGLRAGYSMEDLFTVQDPDMVLNLWRAAVAIEEGLWE